MGDHALVNSLMLVLVLLLPSPTDLTAHRVWDQLSWEYQITPLSLGWADQSGNGIALHGGFDAQGRAAVTFDPIMRTYTEAQTVKSTFHEAAHVMLRQMGAPYGGLYEENVANSFAHCRMGTPYFPIKPCPEIMEIFAHLHR